MKSFRVALIAALLASTAAGAIAADKPRFGTWGVDLAAADRAVKPGDDFWRYANGSWDRTTTIAPDRTSAGVSVLLADQAETQVRAIVDELAAKPGVTGDDKRVGDFYAAWMDEAGIEARGTAPLKPYLDRVAAVKDRAGLLKLFAAPGYPSPIGVGILPDPANPTRYIAAASQSGLGLPNRDYYLLEGAKYDAIRKAYHEYMVKLQTLAGIPDPVAKADAIFALETRIAKAHWTPERSRDIKQIYNPMNRAQLTALAPEFDWPTLLADLGLGSVETVIAAETTAIAETGDMLADTPLQTWKDYAAFHFIRAHAVYLPRAFDEANFDFYSRTLRDVQTQRERWKRGVTLLNGGMGEAIGKAYVERHYPPESQRQMSELIANLRTALAQRLAKLDWMDEPTRKEALAKLDAFDPRIGHPAKYVDYSALNVSRTDPLANAVAVEDFGWKLQLSRLPNPVDRTLWEMNPQEVNAYYNPLLNQITFPAAILQPPYFDPNADAAVNYGAIGAVIGHEIGHGFDDQGRQFDATGRIRDWWTADAAKKFEVRADQLDAQYDAYEPIPGTKVNGRLTLGENIGDVGGIEMAYAAYRLHVAKTGEPPVIDGLTGDQRFFLSWAQAWRSKVREGAMRERLLSDPHSPPEFRVNGVVRNVDAWYAAFGVKPGDKLYLRPEDRVRIW